MRVDNTRTVFIAVYLTPKQKAQIKDYAKNVEGKYLSVMIRTLLENHTGIPMIDP